MWEQIKKIVPQEEETANSVPAAAVIQRSQAVSYTHLTRGALTTFSFAHDVAKSFAIIPAMFAGLFVADGMASGPLSALNIMGLNSPQSAILSTVIFNALVIVALIPLALKGVSYRPAGAASLLKRNILIYGVGGLIAPFMGIKLINDLSLIHI